MTWRLVPAAAVAAALFVSIAAHNVAPQAFQRRDPAGLKASYVKRELFIPMRDGVKLFTIVYAPRDTTVRYPFLMTRTAYGIAPYGADDYRAVLGPASVFAREGYHTFLKRHRVMVPVQSSWFPMFDRNPQTFVDIYHASPADYRQAEHKVFRSLSLPSIITLPVLAQSKESSAPVR